MDFNEHGNKHVLYMSKKLNAINSHCEAATCFKFPYKKYLMNICCKSHNDLCVLTLSVMHTELLKRNPSIMAQW